MEEMSGGATHTFASGEEIKIMISSADDCMFISVAFNGLAAGRSHDEVIMQCCNMIQLTAEQIRRGHKKEAKPTEEPKPKSRRAKAKSSE